MNVILGISLSHNGSVSLVCDGEVHSAIQAERISRLKRQALSLNEQNALTAECVKYCLGSAGLDYSDINSVAISTPWAVQKINNSQLFSFIGGTPDNYLGTYYVPHHLAHMEYILHYGDLRPGIVLVLDGSGSLEQDRDLFNVTETLDTNAIDFVHFAGKEVISAYWFDGQNTSLIYRFSPSTAQSDECNRGSNGLLQSVGHYWRWASQYCCGSSNEAGKVMGLAAFGDYPNPDEKQILSVDVNGEVSLNFQELISNFDKPNIFKLDLSSSNHHQNLAKKVQTETETVILKLLEILKEKHETDTLYLSGGVALNVVVNERIFQENLFKNLILNGSVEDNGTAIGAALGAYYQHGLKRKSSPVTDYYGRLYTQDEIVELLESEEQSYQILNKEQVIEFAAQYIFEKKVFGWFQKRSEFGPRALGHRSILANPMYYKTKYILDHYMKCRDHYRPYAPIVIEERANKYFELEEASPVMMRNVRVLDESLTAITHLDGTARVQTINQKDDRRMHSLLLAVEKKIGVPVLLNTSFNLPGEPIVETPADALSSFRKGGLHYLFLENILIFRQ